MFETHNKTEILSVCHCIWWREKTFPDQDAAMKIRSVIFLIVTTLGLFPLFILVALNWPTTISRLEYAVELETLARSNVSFTHLNTRIQCLKKSLIRTATLPSTFAAITDANSVATMTKVLKKWFGNDEQIRGLVLFNAEGREVVGLRKEDGGFVDVTSDENHFKHPFYQKSSALSEETVAVDLMPRNPDPFQGSEDNSYELIMSTPVFNTPTQRIGILTMRINLSEFLDDFKDSYWVGGDGNYLQGCDAASSLSTARDVTLKECDAFGEFPDLNSIEVSDLIILDGKGGRKIAWMPLVFNEQHKTVMWIGSRIDESVLEKWKFRLTINVVLSICTMAVMVFAAATLIAGWIERKRKDLLTGLDEIINNEKRMVFDWNGPREIKSLGQDLTALAERYCDTSEARRLAESSLRESEDKFRNLTASALDGIILMNSEGDITYWNEAATAILGYSYEEALGNPIHSLIEPRREGGELLQPSPGEQDSSLNFSQTVELVVRNHAGKDVFVELSLSSTTISGQWHAIWIVRDISERKRIEEEKRIQQQQLLQADKMISLGLLVSGVAHEINNPNSIVLLNLPLLTRAWESALPILDDYYKEYGDFSVGGVEYSTMRQEMKRIFTELDESAHRIKQIVVDLKDYARQETSGQMSPVDITEVVKAGVRLTANSISKATDCFVSRYATDLPPVLGNRQRLIQVVINLIQNSCEAIDNPDLSLTISTRYNREKDGIEISICDEGVGIVPECLNKVTDPFFTTKRSMGGTGLGLSVSAGIVKEHSGVLNFYSELNKGTEVVLILPAMVAEPLEKEAAQVRT